MPKVGKVPGVNSLIVTQIAIMEIVQDPILVHVTLVGKKSTDVVTNLFVTLNVKKDFATNLENAFVNRVGKVTIVTNPFVILVVVNMVYVWLQTLVTVMKDGNSLIVLCINHIGIAIIQS